MHAAGMGMLLKAAYRCEVLDILLEVANEIHDGKLLLHPFYMIHLKIEANNHQTNTGSISVCSACR